MTEIKSTEAKLQTDGCLPKFYLNELAIMSPMFDKQSNIKGMPTIA